MMDLPQDFGGLEFFDGGCAPPKKRSNKEDKDHDEGPAPKVIRG